MDTKDFVLALKPAKELRSQRTKLTEFSVSAGKPSPAIRWTDGQGDGLKLGNKTKSHISGKRNKGGEEARAPTSFGHIETAANIGTRIAPHHPFPNRSSLLPSPSLPHVDDFFWNGRGFSLLGHFLSPLETKLEVCLLCENFPQQTELLSFFSIPLLPDFLYSLSIFGIYLLLFFYSSFILIEVTYKNSLMLSSSF